VKKTFCSNFADFKSKWKMSNNIVNLLLGRAKLSMASCIFIYELYSSPEFNLHDTTYKKPKCCCKTVISLIKTADRLHLVVTGLPGDPFGVHQFVELWSCQPGDVHFLELFPVPIEELELGRLARHFFELGVLEKNFEIIREEFLNLRKLVQTSSGAWFDDSRGDNLVRGVLSYRHVLIVCPHRHNAGNAGK